MAARTENVSFDAWLAQMNADFNQEIDVAVDAAATATKIAGPIIIQETANLIKEATGNDPALNASIQLLSDESQECSSPCVDTSAKTSKAVSKASVDASISLIRMVGNLFC